MTKRIYVGNLPFQTSEQQVRDLFARYGTVDAVTLINDAQTGKFRGFGFVEMPPAQADSAISALNGRSVGGRKLRVNAAQPRPNRKKQRRNRKPAVRTESENFRVRDDYLNSAGSGEQYRVRDDFLKGASSDGGFRARDALQEGRDSTGEGYRARDEFQHIDDNARDNRKRSKGNGKHNGQAGKGRRRR